MRDSKSINASITTPLLVKDYDEEKIDETPKKKRKYVSNEEMFSTRKVPENYMELNISRKSGFSANLGRLLAFGNGYVKYLRIFYITLLGNVLLCCSSIWICKLLDKYPYLSWNQNFLPPGNWFFQWANIFLIISYTMSDYLLLRVCLFLGCAFFGTFGLVNPAGYMLDTFLFNLTMSLLNGYYIIQILWERRHIDFAPEFEFVYEYLFKDFLPRAKFLELTKHGLTRFEKRNSLMHDIGDEITSLCIVVQGKVIMKNREGRQINYFRPKDAIEASFWASQTMNPEGLRFRHQMITATDVYFVKWTRESLVRAMERDPAIRMAVRAVLGIATARNWRRFGKVNVESLCAESEFFTADQESSDYVIQKKHRRT